MQALLENPSLTCEISPNYPPTDSDILLEHISRDVQAEVRAHPFLNRRAKASGRRNPLRPVSVVEDKRAGKSTLASHQSLDGSSSSSSSGDEADLALRDEDVARGDKATVIASEAQTSLANETPRSSAKEGQSAAKAREDEVEPLASRRRLFNRMRLLQNAANKAQLRQHSGSDTSESQSPVIVLSPSMDEPHSGSSTTQQRIKGPRLRQHKNRDALVPKDSALAGGGPITLLTPTPAASLPEDGKDAKLQLEDINLSRPDTHAECIIRVAWTFFRGQKAWKYRTEMLGFIRLFYTLFASGGDLSAIEEGPRSRDDKRRSRREVATQDSDVGLNGWARHAEAETYWAVSAMMTEVGDLFIEVNALPKWSQKLARRVKWADDGLYQTLVSEIGKRNLVSVAEEIAISQRSKQISPATSLVYRRWCQTLFSDLSTPATVLPLWDYILSSTEPGSSTSWAVETITDICTAMVVILKEDLVRDEAYPNVSANRDLWGSETMEQIVFDQFDAEKPEHERSLMHTKEIALLNHFPLNHVGSQEILRIADEIKKQRIQSAREEDGPSDAELSDDEAESGISKVGDNAISSKLSEIAAAAGNKVANRWSNSHVPVPALPSPQTLRNSVSLGGNALRQYLSNVQDSDAAARASKLTSNLSATALARWNTVGKQSSAEGADQTQPNSPSKASSVYSTEWNGYFAGASKYLGNLAIGAKQREINEVMAREEFADSTNLAPSPSPSRPISPEIPAGADLHRRDTNLPPSFFISPRGSIVYPQGRYQQRGAGRGRTKPSLQHRLAAAAATAAVQHRSVSGSSSSGPDRSVVRPLLLSGSARPASPTRSTHSARSASITSSHSGRGSPSGIASPSGSVGSLELEGAISRKIPLRRSSAEGGSQVSVSAFGGARTGLRRGGGGEIQSAAILNRITGGPARDDAANASEDDDAERRARYALQDFGPSRRPREEGDEVGNMEGRYQLVDEPILNRDAELSLAGGLGDIGKGKAIRRPRVQARPGGLKLNTPGGISSSNASATTSTEDLPTAGLRASKEGESALASTAQTESLESPTTPRAHRTSTEYQDASSSPLMKRSNRMVQLDSRSASIGVASDGADKGIENTPERLKKQDDQYGDLLENYAALENI